ncbi:MAG: hypothetical protein AAGA05_03275 [Pseudomonadota bacterium]
MALADPQARLPIWQRLLFAVPIFGWVARDLTLGDADNVWYALGGFASLWAISVVLFGIPGLYIPALLLVPVIWVVLLLITRG